jgi:hypothetical protein
VKTSHLFLGSLIVMSGAWFALRDGSRAAPSTPTAEASAPTARAAAPTSSIPARRERVQPRAPLTAPEAAETPPPPPTVQQRRDDLLTELRASGDASGPWMMDARAVIDGADFECHRGGCVATVAYPDELAFELDDERITKSASFLAYQGWRHRAITRDDAGGVTATWYFMNPADARE